MDTHRKYTCTCRHTHESTHAHVDTHAQTQMYVHTCKDTQADVDTHRKHTMHMWTHTQRHTCACMDMQYLHTLVYMWISKLLISCTCICKCTCVYVCMCVCTPCMLLELLERNMLTFNTGSCHWVIHGVLGVIINHSHPWFQFCKNKLSIIPAQA